MTEQIYKPGLEGVIAGDTALSSVEQVGLWYRGYSIEELAEHCAFEEIAYLLWRGELPTKGQLAEIKASLDKYRPLNPAVVATIRAMPEGVPMMDVLRTGVSMSGHFCPVEGEDGEPLRQRAMYLTAQIAGIIAARYRLLNGKEPLDPKPGLSHAAQILYQCHGADPSAQAERTLDLTLILYAEHEFNASTFVSRVCASTLSDMVSCVVGAIGTLKGPLHGGANERAMELINRFKSADEADEWVHNAFKTKEKIMGFGHRVYKQGDHRAWILEEHMKKLAVEKGEKTKVEIYDRLKNIMDSEKKIFPNVDYPCGLTYYLMDLPLDLYTPLFVASRVTGWTAHIIEQHEHNRIIRPLSRYTGPAKRKLVPVDQRG
jgi:citrate synthase